MDRCCPLAGVFALNYWAWFRRTAEWWMGDVSSVSAKFRDSFSAETKEIRQLLTRFEADFSKSMLP